MHPDTMTPESDSIDVLEWREAMLLDDSTRRNEEQDPQQDKTSGESAKKYTGARKTSKSKHNCEAAGKQRLGKEGYLLCSDRFHCCHRSNECRISN